MRVYHLSAFSRRRSQRRGLSPAAARRTARECPPPPCSLLIPEWHAELPSPRLRQAQATAGRPQAMPVVQPRLRTTIQFTPLSSRYPHGPLPQPHAGCRKESATNIFHAACIPCGRPGRRAWAGSHQGSRQALNLVTTTNNPYARQFKTGATSIATYRSSTITETSDH